jgi:hypothetical protein
MDTSLMKNWRLILALDLLTLVAGVLLAAWLGFL